MSLQKIHGEFFINLKQLNVTKAEVISQIADKTGIDKADVSVTVEALFSVIKNSMAEGENIYVRGFGSFINKKRAKKIARNISKNTAIVIDEHYIPSFKPSKVFIEKIKKIACTSLSSIILWYDGTVLTAGCNEKPTRTLGRIPSVEDDEIDDSFGPVHLFDRITFDNVLIEDVDGGSEHALLLPRDGISVIRIGDYRSVDDRGDVVYYDGGPDDPPCTTLELLLDFKVTAIAAGASFSIAVAENNEVYLVEGTPSAAALVFVLAPATGMNHTFNSSFDIVNAHFLSLLPCLIQYTIPQAFTLSTIQRSLYLHSFRFPTEHPRFRFWSTDS